MRWRAFANHVMAAAICGLLLGGCAGVVLPPVAKPVSTGELLAGEPFGGTQPALLPDPQEVIGATAEMHDFAVSHVPAFGTEYEKMRGLLFALRATGRFDLVYEDRTHTALQTFSERRGNCLGFTNMFIALARVVNLSVAFQEGDVPPVWTREGGSIIVSRHINASIMLEPIGEHVVDFNMSDFRSVYPRHRISDARGLAHFYSNIGAELMVDGDARGAFTAFERALRQDPGFAAAWNNLGVLYLRAARTDYAESAWRHALEIAPGDLSVMNNLASLYEKLGRRAEAAQLDRELEYYRSRNPYYRYWLAERAFTSGDYREATAQLRHAIKLQPYDDTFYALLALSYARMSDTESARHWLAKAAEVASDDESRKIYDRKLELLRASSGG